ncbi:hypothetical protein [Kiloniella antarctica]|uniref:Uncharacterized protein n=1 Tax=Kiloniella antarctica TaxID=1550907 RepID=A0ABW5BM48_9PROT
MNESPINEPTLKPNEDRSASKTVLIFGVFLIISGIVLYFFAMSGPPSGVAMNGIFWGLLALFGWALIGLGLIIFCWLIIRRIIKNCYG